MGLFKDMKKGVKDMRETVAAAPGMLEQAQQLRASGMAMQAAAQAQHVATQSQFAPPSPVSAGAPTGEGPELAAVSGVSLALYADICKAIAAFNYDQSKLVVIAAQRGIDAASWQSASDTWNARITANPAVAKQFNRLYTGR